MEDLQRVKVETLEALLGKPFPVLDHGFIRVIDYMGDDGAIVQAARVSYGKGTKKAQEDEGLIRYLLRHHHTTPFEMCELKLHIKLPIFVARQWIRHRTANVNEYSARYSILDNEFYLPEEENLTPQSEDNKQGRSDQCSAYAKEVREKIKQDSEACYAHYQEMLQGHEGQGIARELARMALPVNFYTQMYWKIDLHNLLHFLYLRADAHAQWEIREYAHVLLKIVENWVPFTYRAFMDYKVQGRFLSGPALDLLRKMVRGQNLPKKTSLISAREMKEIADVLGLSVCEESS